MQLCDAWAVPTQGIELGESSKLCKIDPSPWVKLHASFTVTQIKCDHSNNEDDINKPKLTICLNEAPSDILVWQRDLAESLGSQMAIQILAPSQEMKNT